jgi:glycosyltransferase involved in cell wall biosynthesis
MKLISFIVPVYNEEKNVEKTFHQIKNSAKNIIKKIEIIFVDDCSTDKTNFKITKLKKKFFFVKVVRNKSNLGFARTFLKGAKFAKGEYLQLIPGDNCFKSKEIKKILDQLHKSKYDWILADTKDLNNSRTLIREVFSRFFVWTVNILFLKNFRYYNGIHAIKSKIFNSLTIKSQSPLFLCEILLKVLKKTKNYKIVRAYFTERTEGVTKIFNLKTIFKTVFELILLRVELWFE